MKTNLKVFYAVILSLFIAACEEEMDTTQRETSQDNELLLSDEFNWKTTQNVTFNIGVKYAKSSNLKAKITFYDGNPEDCGNVLTTGFASEETALNAKVVLPSALKEVYVTCEFPTGAKTFTTFNVNTMELSCLFDENDIEVPKKVSHRSAVVLPTADDADVVLSGGGLGKIQISGGDVYAVKKDSTKDPLHFSFQFYSEGTLIVCDSASTSADYFSLDEGIVIIEEGARLRVSPVFNFSSGGVIYNFGELDYKNGDFECAGTIYNYGTITIDGSLSIKSS